MGPQNMNLSALLCRFQLYEISNCCLQCIWSCHVAALTVPANHSLLSRAPISYSSWSMHCY